MIWSLEMFYTYKHIYLYGQTQMENFNHLIKVSRKEWTRKRREEGNGFLKIHFILGTELTASLNTDRLESKNSIICNSWPVRVVSSHSS